MNILKHVFISNLLISLILHLSSPAIASITNCTRFKPGVIGHYAMKMYYVTCGTGSPVILLHGALSTIDKDLGAIIPAHSKNHQVIGIELQGHEHTTDIDRPLSYEAMAGDVVLLLQQLKIYKADFLGYSMGGGVALQLTIVHPELVRHLLLISTAFNPAGMNMDNPEGLRQKVRTDLNQSVWKKNYDKVVSDTSKWSKLVNKIYGVMGTWKGFQPTDIKSIKSPALLIFGDEDMSKPDHQVEMFKLLGGGHPGDLYELPNEQLAILPCTTHVTMVDQTDLLFPIVTRL